jgi:hypothetical protein
MGRIKSTIFDDQEYDAYFQECDFLTEQIEKEYMEECEAINGIKVTPKTRIIFTTDSEDFNPHNTINS